MGRPSLAAAEVATGRVEVDGVGTDDVLGDAGAAGGGVAITDRPISVNTCVAIRISLPLAASAAFLAFQASNLSRFMRSFASSGVSSFGVPLLVVGAALAPF